LRPLTGHKANVFMILIGEVDDDLLGSCTFKGYLLIPIFMADYHRWIVIFPINQVPVKKDLYIVNHPFIILSE